MNTYLKFALELMCSLTWTMIMLETTLTPRNKQHYLLPSSGNTNF